MLHIKQNSKTKISVLSAGKLGIVLWAEVCPAGTIQELFAESTINDVGEIFV